MGKLNWVSVEIGRENSHLSSEIFGSWFWQRFVDGRSISLWLPPKFCIWFCYFYIKSSIHKHIVAIMQIWYLKYKKVLFLYFDHLVALNCIVLFCWQYFITNVEIIQNPNLFRHLRFCKEYRFFLKFPSTIHNLFIFLFWIIIYHIKK